MPASMLLNLETVFHEYYNNGSFLFEEMGDVANLLSTAQVVL